MTAGPIDYGLLIRDGLRSVMARVLAHTVEHGLQGDQHYFIAYSTQHSGVVMPDWLRAQFPEEIAIILQYEYSDLAVMADRFSVSLTFSDRPAHLVIPFAAVRMFRDPSVGFQIEFPPSDDATTSLAGMETPRVGAPEPEAAPAPDPSGDPVERVLSLDAFRKK